MGTRNVTALFCCAGCYFAAENKFKLEHYLIDYGFLTGRHPAADECLTLGTVHKHITCWILTLWQCMLNVR